MKMWRETLVMTAAALVCSPVPAQESDAELDERMREAERRLAAEAEEREAAQKELERAAEAIAQEAMALAERQEADTEEVHVRMREAERRMAEAARQMAELSMRQLPRVERYERIIRANRGPVLGVTIGGADGDDPVEGVEVLGVTPGGAAEDAGLRAGDVISSINGESLTAENSEQATAKLLDFMQGVEAGDELDVEYLRNGRSDTVTVTPRPIDDNVFAFHFDTDDFSMPDIQVAPGVGGRPGFVWIGGDRNFGDMEMVTLTEQLGSYFGTAEGLLVVRAPSNEDLKLQDGDVILSIDGREPKSVEHAVRILGSYQAGEELSIDIMRDQRRQRIDIVMPDNRRSLANPGIAPRAVIAPRTVIVTGEDKI